MRGIKELLQLVLDRVNELDTKEMGICFFKPGDWDIRRRYLSYLISKL